MGPCHRSFCCGRDGLGGGAERELALGVLAYQSPEEIHTRWQPLADYLSEHVPGIRVSVPPLMRHEAESGLERGELHLPGDAAILRHHADLARATRLRDALNTDAFGLYGQLILPTHPCGEPHCEVLLRLQNGDTLTAPDSFIPAAERQRLMPRLDRWVVRQALALFAPLQDAAVLAVNLSAQSVQDPRLGNDLLRWFDATGVCSDRVCFEITETAALDNLEQVARLVHGLQELGCRFALDDCGSGLFSFGMLRSLPVDYLKIDGKLVRDFMDDEVAEVMLSTIFELGQLLGVRTIAEWVEVIRAGKSFPSWRWII